MHLKKSSIVSKEKYPEKVRSRFAELRAELPYHITIRAIKHSYYVVRQEYSPLDENGKRKMFSEYLGKITENGEFMPRKTASQTAFDVATAIIRAKGGKVIMPEANEGAVHEVSNIQLSEKEGDVLMNLTMNARMPYDMLSKNAGMSIKDVSNTVGRLERRLSLSYVPDIRLTKLGFMEFFIFVKFEGKKPNPEAASTDLKTIGNIQFAAFTTGTYDMILFVLAENNENLAELLRSIKRVPSLSSLPSRWEVSYFNKTKSFIPLRSEFFDVLEKYIWHRTKEVPRPLPTQLLKSEFGVLKSLTKDGMVKFAEIERDNGLAQGSASHIYDRLIKKGILPRVTIDIDRLDIKYEAVIIMEIIEEAAFQDSRKKLLEFIMEEEEGNVINRFSLVGDTSNHQGVILFLPVINSNELEKAVSSIQSRIKGIEVSTLVIDSVMFGRILHRRQDPLTTAQYNALVSDYKMKFPEKRVYDEDIFYRIEKIQSRQERPNKYKEEAD